MSNSSPLHLLAMRRASANWRMRSYGLLSNIGGTSYFGKRRPKSALHVSEPFLLSPGMASSTSTPLEDTILILDSLCRSKRLEYAIFGGIASILYGSGRATIDIDLIVRIEIDALEEVYRSFLDEFQPVKQHPLEFFKTYFVLPVVHKTLGTKVDISAALSQFEREAIRRGKRLRYGSVEASFCTPEDLILFKLVANRERDILDVKDIIKRMRDTLDGAYLRTHAEDFVEVDRPDILENLELFLRAR
jgi:hypothetical protein